jgi:hypothetical protein
MSSNDFSGGGSLLTSLHAISHFLHPMHLPRSTRHPKGSGGALDFHSAFDGAALETIMLYASPKHAVLKRLQGQIGKDEDIPNAGVSSFVI